MSLHSPRELGVIAVFGVEVTPNSAEAEPSVPVLIHLAVLPTWLTMKSCKTGLSFVAGGNEGNI